jgi:hypothetical protein
MSLPRFTAEAALGRPSRTYHGKCVYGGSASGRSEPPAVVPNQYDVVGDPVEYDSGLGDVESLAADDAGLEQTDLLDVEDESSGLVAETGLLAAEEELPGLEDMEDVEDEGLTDGEELT